MHTHVAHQDELKQELAELEQEELNARLAGADRAPTNALPTAREEGTNFIDVAPIPTIVKLCFTVRQPAAVEADEEAQLRELQASLAM